MEHSLQLLRILVFPESSLLCQKKLWELTEPRRNFQNKMPVNYALFDCAYFRLFYVIDNFAISQ